MITVFAFLVVIVLLVLVHEAGHFWAAKRSGMRVDEFGIGFPPRLWSIKKGETVYSINLLPFGGFVKIYGEDGEIDEEKGRSFVGSSTWKQIVTLLAGVSMNFLFAWILFSASFIIGQQVPTALDPRVEDPVLFVTDVLPRSPAEKAGVRPGDTIVSIQNPSESIEYPTPEDVQMFIRIYPDMPITLDVGREGEEVSYIVVPERGLGGEERALIGVAMDTVGTLRLPPHEAVYEGAYMTIRLSQKIVEGLGGLFKDLFQGEAGAENLAGPIGIASLAGDAFKVGLVNFISFTALISIHLALLNLLPIPALDGGRVLFVLIESITRKKISGHIVQLVNAGAFILLVGLMLFVTYQDIVRLF